MPYKKIAIGSDHAGFVLKEIIIKYLKDRNYHVLDRGSNSAESVDYPEYAASVCRSVLSGESDAGVLICGTGIGMSIAANRFRGIRAALCHDAFTAKMSRKHNNANIIVMGAGVIGAETAKDMLNVWLTEEFEGGRHERRINKIENVFID